MASASHNSANQATLSDSSAADASVGLIDRLLQKQQQLTAVERFAQQQDARLKPELSPVYRDLIPLEKPSEGEQYSFEVDLDACSGCKACVAACHNLNGLEEDELWRNVGTLVGGNTELPVIQHVTASCHHCLEPACMGGCPVNAYEKDPITGIVEHLDDQCIGCKYCMFMCPYDVPTYSSKKGIVRKCNMCSDRLAVGEAPACVQACPHEAIKIRKVSREEIIENSETDQLVPGAPDVHLTLPTTRYNTKKVLPRNLLPNDYYVSKSLHAHFPLVFMLTLTQMAFGIFAACFFVQQAYPSISAGLFARLDAIGFAILCAGLGVATLHLGRPFKAYRAMAGLRTSWLSREILCFNLFAGAASGLLAWGWLAMPEQITGISRTLPAAATVIAGAIAVASSAMLYIATKRPLWTAFRTSSFFFLTGAIVGIATVMLAMQWALVDSKSSAWLFGSITESGSFDIAAALNVLAQALMLFTVCKLAIEGSIFGNLWSVQFTPQRHAASLMAGELRWTLIIRFALLVSGGLLLPSLFLANAQATDAAGSGAVLMTFSAVMLLVGELFERYMFFAVSVARRMPGAPN